MKIPGYVLSGPVEILKLMNQMSAKIIKCSELKWRIWSFTQMITDMKMQELHFIFFSVMIVPYYTALTLQMKDLEIKGYHQLLKITDIEPSKDDV